MFKKESVSMKRRVFLLATLVLLGVKSSGSGLPNHRVLVATLEHLFPTTSRFVGARALGFWGYLQFVMRHPSFSREDVHFLFEGAKRLAREYPLFLIYAPPQKEMVLRRFEETLEGQEWLSQLLYYGLEAMLGDPIYGGNTKMQGWRNFAHTPPQPMAKTPFGKACG